MSYPNTREITIEYIGTLGLPKTLDPMVINVVCASGKQYNMAELMSRVMDIVDAYEEAERKENGGTETQHGAS